MTKVTTRQHLRPLSFAFKRHAEMRELELLVSRIEALLPSDKTAFKTLFKAVGWSLLSFVFVAPFVVLFAYTAQTLTHLPLLNTDSLYVMAFFWLSLFLINACTSLIVERKFALKQLKSMKADLNNQMVLEETWRFVAAKSLSFPETNKVCYLLLADTGDIIALSYAQPPADLTLLRAPLSLLYIMSFSSGPILELEASYSYLGKDSDAPLEGENLRLTRSLAWNEVEAFASGL
jgi:hypothetical protein